MCIHLTPEEIALQNQEFTKFIEQLHHFTKETIKELFGSNNIIKSKNLLTINSEATNAPFFASNDLMISLLSARQIIEYLPIFKDITQSAINHLGYNYTLPKTLDNKVAILTTHLMLGSAAAQMLPTDLIRTGMIISNIGTGVYGVRLTATSYLKEQQPTDEPIEIAAQCGTAVLLYNLPNIATYAAVQTFLPGTAYTITGYDILTSSGFGAIQCASNYKFASVEPTIADTAMPLMIDVAVLLMLSKNLNVGASSFGILMLSIKNAMSIATTVYATDSMTRMVMDMMPQEIKEEYIDPAFNFAYNTFNNVNNTCYQAVTDVRDYLTEEASLIIDYAGTINLGEEA